MLTACSQPNSSALFLHDFCITEFGKKTIDTFKSNNITVRIIESPVEIIKFARKQKETRFYLYISGFEPMTALIAATILAAQNENLTNVYFSTELYQSSPFIPALYKNQSNSFDGIFIPGHIVAPLGYEIYETMVQELSIPIIITGTEIPDIVQSVSMLLAQLEQKVTRLEIQFRPGIRPQGNPISKQKIESVFECENITLPDMGLIPKGRFTTKKEFAQYLIK